MAKFVIGLLLIFILILNVVSVNVANNNSPSSGSFLCADQDDWLVLDPSINSRKLNMVHARGFLPVTIDHNGFLVIENDQRVPSNTNCQGNHGEQVECSNMAARKQPCESLRLPNGYRVTLGIGAHKYHAARKNWNDARHTCTKEGGHLLVINSKAEEKLIVEQLRAANWPDMWLGIHDLFAFRNWVTVENVPLNETGWATWTPIYIPNPDNFGGNQHCVHLLDTGMDDEECSMEKNFVCKISCV